MSEKIIGYKDLTEAQINMVNQTKSIENEVGKWIKQMLESNVELDQRWMAIARTELQHGFGSLNRAVTQPDSEL